MKPLLQLFKTHDECAPVVLRLLLAVVMFPHGAQKMLGWWGGHGFEGTMRHFTENMNIPAPFALLVIITEFFGPMLLVLGLLTRVAALGIGILITVAAIKVHLPYGFFMNWSGNQQGEGFEYHILVLAIALALVIQGGGKLSADGAIYRALAAKQLPSVAPELDEL